jgi:dTDP-4-amino-4,6-dideoxygalactose transaminase
VKIPIAKPFFGPEELEAIQRPLTSGWVVQGPHVREFERRFAAFTQARHAVATSSGTSALQVGVAALGPGPGDEVLVPAFTWVSTANVVEQLGARPLFVDIDLRTFNVATDALEAAVTERTVGIIPVHLFGLCAEMDPVLDLARRSGLWVLEDAACAFGSAYEGRPAGTLGDAAAFSFHPRKSITTGEGGMLTTDRDDLADAFRSLRDHGAATREGSSASPLLPDYERLGFNYRLTDIQGALGCAQLNRADWILAERRRLAALYDTLLAPLEWLRTPVAPAGQTHSYQAYVALFAPAPPTRENVDDLFEQRVELMARLEARGIATRQGTHAPHIQAYYAEKYSYRPEDFFNAYVADRLTLALPLYAGMTDADVELVATSLDDCFAG